MKTMSEKPEQMPDNVTNQPLVTFALFAYNQEQYIREAVEAAFAQTYQPLEIILSDDGSQDETFNIMLDMAHKYKGPHKVKAQKTKNNMGTLAHVVEVANIASGELLVLAAGDDISRPERTARLTQKWLETKAWGLFSDFAKIDEFGKTVAQISHHKMLASASYRLKKYVKHNSENLVLILGATSAYDRRLFKFIQLSSNQYILSEDAALSILLHLLGKNVVKVEETLVEYRAHKGSLTNAKNQQYTYEELWQAEKKIELFSRSQANSRAWMLSLDEQLNGASASYLNRSLITEDMKKHIVRARWRTLKTLTRLKFIASNLNKGTLSWSVPRLLPPKVFLRLKLMKQLVFIHLGKFR